MTSLDTKRTTTLADGLGEEQDKWRCTTC